MFVSVKHVTASPGRLNLFGELSKQLKKSKKHLILDVTTRWNATYAMLSTALEFKEVFVNYAQRDRTYKTLPSDEDWKNVEDVCCNILNLFLLTIDFVVSQYKFPVMSFCALGHR